MPDNMDPKTLLIMKSYDIQKLSRTCNNPGCSRPPAKEITIFEFDARTAKKRGLITLYLCSDHYAGLEDFLNRLKGLCKKGRIIQKEIFDIGCVTY